MRNLLLIVLLATFVLPARTLNAQYLDAYGGALVKPIER